MEECICIGYFIDVGTFLKKPCCYDCMAVLNEKKYLLLRWISEIFVINVLGLISMDVNTRQIVIAMSK